MKSEIENAIKVLIKKSTEEGVALQAMQFAQAAVNLVQIWATIDNAENKRKP